MQADASSGAPKLGAPQLGPGAEPGRGQCPPRSVMEHGEVVGENDRHLRKVCADSEDLSICGVSLGLRLEIGLTLGFAGEFATGSAGPGRAS